VKTQKQNPPNFIGFNTKWVPIPLIKETGNAGFLQQEN
jgi:hypothetical protein